MFTSFFPFYVLQCVNSSISCFTSSRGKQYCKLNISKTENKVLVQVSFYVLGENNLR